MSESDLNRFMSYNLFWSSSSVQLSVNTDETRTRNSATWEGQFYSFSTTFRYLLGLGLGLGELVCVLDAGARRPTADLHAQ